MLHRLFQQCSPPLVKLCVHCQQRSVKSRPQARAACLRRGFGPSAVCSRQVSRKACGIGSTVGAAGIAVSAAACCVSIWCAQCVPAPCSLACVTVRARCAHLRTHRPCTCVPDLLLKMCMTSKRALSVGVHLAVLHQVLASQAPRFCTHEPRGPQIQWHCCRRCRCFGW